MPEGILMTYGEAHAPGLVEGAGRAHDDAQEVELRLLAPQEAAHAGALDAADRRLGVAWAAQG